MNGEAGEGGRGRFCDLIARVYDIPHPLWVICDNLAGGDYGFGGELGAFGWAMGVDLHGVVWIRLV